CKKMQAFSKDIPIPSKNASIFCLPFGFTPLTEVRRGRGFAVCSFRKYCAPCLAQGDQVGVQPSVYAWYRFADVKNGKPFLVGLGSKRGVHGFGCMRGIIPPKSKTASCF
ncbi:MAG: hypothetical protein II325_05870, partial [Clostridia bacterium]|nr:hypothetical protein [Clostridia bacterium]